MKVKLVFFCMLVFGNDQIVETRDTEDFSYYAIVQANWIVCGGILITDRYVITPAVCVAGAPNVDVRLDFDEFHLKGEENQVIRSERIFVHEDYRRSNDVHLNNIALVKLSKPAILSKNVQLGKLITAQEAERLEGRFANISGNIEINKFNPVNYVGTKIEYKNTCKDLYKNHFDENQQFCIPMVTPIYKCLDGNVISVRNRIVGFTPYSCSCPTKPKDCSLSCRVLNVVPFLEWMSQIMNIPIEQFTIQESTDNCNLSKIENFVNDFNQTIQKSLNELQKEIKEIQIKEDQHFMQVQEGIKNILKKMDDLNKGQLTIKHEPKSSSTYQHNIHIQTD